MGENEGKRQKKGKLELRRGSGRPLEEGNVDKVCKAWYYTASL